MHLSKTIADHARENMDQSSIAFKLIYSVAVIVKVVEILAIVALAWFFCVVIALL